MGNFGQLLANGGVDLGVIVAVKVGPDRRVGVDVFPATDIPKQRPFAPLNEQRFASEPVAHLGEWMPEILLVELGQCVLFHPSMRLISSNGDRSSSKPVPNG